MLWGITVSSNAPINVLIKIIRQSQLTCVGMSSMMRSTIAKQAVYWCRAGLMIYTDNCLSILRERMI